VKPFEAAPATGNAVLGAMGVSSELCLLTVN